MVFVSCSNGSEESNESIEAIETTTTQETTTSSTTSSTTLQLSLEINKPYSDYYDKDSLHFLIYEIDDLISSDSYYIRFRAKWKELNSIRIHLTILCRL